MNSQKLFLAAIAMLISVAAFSQTDTTKRDTTTRKDTTGKDSTLQIQQAEAASTIQQSEPSAAQQNFPAPNAGRNYIPVLGNFQSALAESESQSITITSDESNAGKIWIEGLAPVKFYALLKAVPGTYKIPAQKQEDKSIAEGTVQYDDETKQITVCVGCGYENKMDSEAATSQTEEITARDKKIATTAKQSKTRTVISFSGTKVEQGTVSVSQ